MGVDSDAVAPQFVGDPQVLSELLLSLRQADSPDAAVQQQIHLAVQNLFSLGDGPCYLAHIFVDMKTESPEVRQRAGLLLKNRMAQKDENYVGSPALEFVKSRLPTAISDPERPIRFTAGSVVTALTQAYGATEVPELLNTLLQMSQGDDANVVEAAYGALQKCMEDELESSADQFTKNPVFKAVAERFLERCLSTASPSVCPMLSICRISLNVLYVFSYHHCFAPGAVFHGVFPRFWQVLGEAATTKDPDIRRLVVMGMLSVFDYAEAVLHEGSTAEPVMKFMLESCKDENYDLRLVALNFWPKAAASASFLPALRTMLEELCSVLMANIRYSEWDYIQLDASQVMDDNADQPDSANEISPQFHYSGKGDDDDDDDEEGGGEPSTTWGSDWTVRKGAALALDRLSQTLGDGILPFVLPRIETALSASDWDERESAVLALGAIAPNTLSGLSPFLPKVLDLLINLSADTRPLLRSISVWTLSRLRMWICYHRQADKDALERLIRCILARCLDRNKRVQEAAVSAFAFIEEDARGLLIPYLEPILKTFVEAAQVYQAKNVLILYDCIGTLASAVGPPMMQPPIAGKLMELLMEKLRNITPEDPSLFALLECFSYLVIGVREQMLPYVPTIADKVIALLKDVVHQYHEYIEGRFPEPPKRDAIEVTLDLLSAITEAAGQEMMTILHAHPEVIQILMLVTVDTPLAQHASVQQAAFALLGDLSQHCMEVLRPHLPRVVPVLADNLVMRSVSVAQNAGWALGQIAQYGGAESIEPFADLVATELRKIVLSSWAPRTLQSNASLTLCRLAVPCPKQTVAHATEAFKPLVRCVAAAPNNPEKMTSVLGVVKMIQAKPDLAQTESTVLLELLGVCVGASLSPTADGPLSTTDGSIMSFHSFKPEDEKMLRELMHWMCQTYPQEVQHSLNEVTPKMKSVLLTTFQSEFSALG